MAHITQVNALTDELVQLITGYFPTTQASAYKTCKDAAARNLRHHRYGRTNQFAVRSSLEGLVEKFRVRNNDPVADVLKTRLKRLGLNGEGFSEGKKPEVLSLLLCLSDRPVENARVEDLEGPQDGVEVSEGQGLSWEDLEREDPLRGPEWEGIDYARSESEEELGARPSSSDVETSTGRTSPASERYEFDVRSLLVSVDESALRHVQKAQAWRDQQHSNVTLNELQLIRETLHALRGLPSSLFKDADGRGAVTPGRTMHVADCSEAAVSSILERTAAVASSVNPLRLFVQRRTGKPLLQAFLAGIERELRGFDEQLASAERRYVDFDGPVVVSLVAVLDEVERLSLFLSRMHELVVNVEEEIWARSHRVLDYLYDAACETQLEADNEVFDRFGKLFLGCLNVYLRPIRAWLLDGEISSDADDFVVRDRDHSVSRSGFWHERYSLRQGSAGVECPGFMAPLINDIFASGKSVALVKELGLQSHLEGTHAIAEEAITYDEIIGTEPSFTLFPFSEALHTTLASWVRNKQSTTWPVLRSHLLTRCHLISTLEAFHTIFLSATGSLFDSFLDNPSTQISATSNPFMLETLARTHFADSPVIDPRNLSLTLDRITLSKKGLKQFEAIHLTYATDWPLANIVRPSSLHGYQRAMHLLLQLKRAIGALSGLRMRPALFDRRDNAGALDRTELQLRHRLTHILYTTLSHLTQRVIHVSFLQLRQQIREAHSFDGMIDAHASFVERIRNGTFQVAALKTAREAMVGVCNITVLFAESRAVVRKGSREEEVKGGKESTRAQARQTLGQLKQLVDVVVGGLRDACRSEKGAWEAGWEGLAEELEWDHSEQ